MMQYTLTTETQPDTRMALTISVPWEEWQKEIDAARSHMQQHVKASGFRVGKVPAAVVEREIGRPAILAEAAERAIKKVYADAVRANNFSVIGRPEVSITKMEEQAPLDFVAHVTLLPVLTLKNGWRAAVAAVNAQHTKEPHVDDADVDKELETLARARAKSTSVDRPAQKEDVAIINFTVSVDGVPIEGGTGKEHPLVLGSGTFIPGFEDAVVGMRAGEEKTVTLTFPASYHATHLAGKPASFAITLVRVEERAVPQIDDAFAQSLGKFATLADVRASIRDGLLREARDKAVHTRREALADVIAENVDVTIPTLLVEQELAQMESRLEQQFAQSGMAIADVLSQMDKTIDDLRTDWRPQAQKRATIGLAFDHIAEAFSIVPDSEKIESEMNALMMRMGDDARKKVDVAHLYEYTKASLRQEDVFAYLERITKDADA